MNPMRFDTAYVPSLHRCNVRLIFIGRDEQLAGEIFNGLNAKQPHRQIKLGNNVFDDLAYSIGAGNSQPVGVWPTEWQALAPSAKAISTSVPDRMPLSSKIVGCGPTASRTETSASREAIALSPAGRRGSTRS
jgi:hypothetical protein